MLNSLINKQECQMHKVTESSTIFNTSVYGYVVVGSLFLIKLVELSPEQFVTVSAKYIGSVALS